MNIRGRYQKSMEGAKRQKRMMEKVWKAGRFLQNLLFPLKCPICDEIIPREGFCRECKQKLDFLQDCGRVKREHIAEGRVLLKYETVAPALYRFKYGGRREYAGCFAAEMAEELGMLINGWNADGIMGVPLHKKRQRKRGYNQAALLAKELSKCLGIPFYDNLVKRVKNTIPLKELNAAERQNNLKKAFKLCQNDVKLNTIIIVDDIYTTGQTVEEIAKLLCHAGTDKIYVLAVAGGEGD